ncbi:MAG: PHP domain-containing protein [Christensenellales bacterium]
MEYLYDPHTHTAEVSPCGRIRAAEVIGMYHAHGYAGIVVTDHLHEEYISSLPCRDDWQACVDAYMAGYRLAVQEAEKCGMDALFGAEIRFPENNRDYLLYGIDEAFLRRNPYPHRLDHRTFFERFGHEILIIQAHPYRDFDEGSEEIYVDCIHGIEVINCNPRHDSQNHRAAALQKDVPGLLGICGSDTHRPGDEARAAIVFPRRVQDSFGFKAAVEGGDYLLRGCAAPA